jgi:hypothetical protein
MERAAVWWLAVSGTTHSGWSQQQQLEGPGHRPVSTAGEACAQQRHRFAFLARRQYLRLVTPLRYPTIELCAIHGSARLHVKWKVTFCLKLTSITMWSVLSKSLWLEEGGTEYEWLPQNRDFKLFMAILNISKQIWRSQAFKFLHIHDAHLS